MNRNLEIIYNAIKPLTNEFVVRPLLGDAISDGIIRYYQLNKDILKLPEIDYAEMLISAFDNTILNNEKFLQTSYNYFLGQKIIELLSEKNNIDNTLSLTKKREKLISLGKQRMKNGIIDSLQLDADFFNPKVFSNQKTKEIITPFSPTSIKDPDFKELIEKEFLSLHSYQKKIKDRIVQKLIYDSKGKLLVHMPTGSGKTKTAIEAIIDFIRVTLKSEQQSTVIWFAHSKELCDQAYETFKKMWKFKGDFPINAYKYFGDSELDEVLNIQNDNLSIIFIGFQKFNPVLNAQFNDKKRPLRKYLYDCTRLVIVDEAHKSLAHTYKNAIEFVSEMPNCRLLGLTATPGRSNYIEGDNQNQELAEFFGIDIVSITDEDGSKLNNPLEFLQNSNPQVLAQIDFQELDFSIDLTQFYTQEQINKIQKREDLNEKELNRFAVDPHRNKLIINAISDSIEKNESTLVFACTTDHCLILQRLLKLHGINAEVILGTTENGARSKYINDFKKGSLKVLINYGVLSTGFDAPNLNTLIVARPTKSIVLYSQIVGRALRGPANGGNKKNKIVTIKDNLIGFPNADFMFSYWDTFWN